MAQQWKPSTDGIRTDDQNRPPLLMIRTLDIYDARRLSCRASGSRQSCRQKRPLRIPDCGVATWPRDPLPLRAISTRVPGSANPARSLRKTSRQYSSNCCTVVAPVINLEWLSNDMSHACKGIDAFTANQRAALPPCACRKRLESTLALSTRPPAGDPTLADRWAGTITAFLAPGQNS